MSIPLEIWLHEGPGGNEDDAPGLQSSIASAKEEGIRRQKIAFETTSYDTPGAGRRPSTSISISSWQFRGLCPTNLEIRASEECQSRRRGKATGLPPSERCGW